jgi:hypothetical protein
VAVSYGFLLGNSLVLLGALLSVLSARTLNYSFSLAIGSAVAGILGRAAAPHRGPSSETIALSPHFRDSELRKRTKAALRNRPCTSSGKAISGFVGALRTDTHKYNRGSHIPVIRLNIS